MTTVTILPLEMPGGTTYQALASGRMAEGKTAGQALDALTLQFPDVGDESLLVVRRLGPDDFFTAAQQTRLKDLFDRWRKARDLGESLSAGEQVELESLVEAEVEASGIRAAAIAKELGK